MRIKGKVINVNPRPGGGAGIVFDAKSFKNYAFFLSDVEDKAGLTAGDEVSGDLREGGVLKAVRIESKAKTGKRLYYLKSKVPALAHKATRIR